MTATIPRQRALTGLSAAEIELLEPIVAKAGERLRAAVDLHRRDPEAAIEASDAIALWVTRRLADVLGVQRCERLNQGLAFRTVGEAIQARAGAA